MLDEEDASDRIVDSKGYSTLLDSKKWSQIVDCIRLVSFGNVSIIHDLKKEDLLNIFTAHRFSSLVKYRSKITALFKQFNVTTLDRAIKFVRKRSLSTLLTNSGKLITFTKSVQREYKIMLDEEDDSDRIVDSQGYCTLLDSKKWSEIVECIRLVSFGNASIIRDLKKEDLLNIFTAPRFSSLVKYRSEITALFKQFNVTTFDGAIKFIRKKSLSTLLTNSEKLITFTNSVQREYNIMLDEEDDSDRIVDSLGYSTLLDSEKWSQIAECIRLVSFGNASIIRDLKKEDLLNIFTAHCFSSLVKYRNKITALFKQFNVTRLDGAIKFIRKKSLSTLLTNSEKLITFTNSVQREYKIMLDEEDASDRIVDSKGYSTLLDSKKWSQIVDCIRLVSFGNVSIIHDLKKEDLLNIFTAHCFSSLVKYRNKITALFKQFNVTRLDGAIKFIRKKSLSTLLTNSEKLITFTNSVQREYNIMLDADVSDRIVGSKGYSTLLDSKKWSQISKCIKSICTKVDFDPSKLTADLLLGIFTSYCFASLIEYQEHIPKLFKSYDINTFPGALQIIRRRKLSRMLVGAGGSPLSALHAKINTYFHMMRLAADDLNPLIGKNSSKKYLFDEQEDAFQCAKEILLAAGATKDYKNKDVLLRIFQMSEFNKLAAHRSDVVLILEYIRKNFGEFGDPGHVVDLLKYIFTYTTRKKGREERNLRLRRFVNRSFTCPESMFNRCLEQMHKIKDVLCCHPLQVLNFIYTFDDVDVSEIKNFIQDPNVIPLELLVKRCPIGWSSKVKHVKNGQITFRYSERKSSAVVDQDESKLYIKISSRRSNLRIRVKDMKELAGTCTELGMHNKGAIPDEKYTKKLTKIEYKRLCVYRDDMKKSKQGKKNTKMTSFLLTQSRSADGKDKRVSSSSIKMMEDESTKASTTDDIQNQREESIRATKPSRDQEIENPKKRVGSDKLLFCVRNEPQLEDFSEKDTQEAIRQSLDLIDHKWREELKQRRGLRIVECGRVDEEDTSGISNQTDNESIDEERSDDSTRQKWTPGEDDDEGRYVPYYVPIENENGEDNADDPFAYEIILVKKENGEDDDEDDFVVLSRESD
eukprot:g1195.t1